MMRSPVAMRPHVLPLLLGSVLSVRAFQHVRPARTSSDRPIRSNSALVLRGGASAFDEAAYEADRLSRDAEAMEAMKRKAEQVEAEAADAAESEFADLRTPWKWTIRKRIWDKLEAENIARPPRPVHHRIPNFDGAERAADRLAELPEFQKAGCVKVNPDTPQKAVRHRVLAEGKTLLTPQPRLRTGFFSTLRADALPPQVTIADVTVSKGVAAGRGGHAGGTADQARRSRGHHRDAHPHDTGAEPGAQAGGGVLGSAVAAEAGADQGVAGSEAGAGGEERRGLAQRTG